MPVTHSKREKKTGRRQVNMQLRFNRPAEVEAMEYIAEQAEKKDVSESAIARDLIVAAVRVRRSGVS